MSLSKKEKREIRQVWGRTKAARELLLLDMSCKDLLFLQCEYKVHCLIGPSWNQTRRMWVIQRYTCVEPGVVNGTYFYSGNLECLTEVDAIVKEFSERQYSTS